MAVVERDPPASEDTRGQSNEIHPSNCPGKDPEPRTRRPAFDVIVVTFWLSLVTGYAEGLYWLGKQEILGSLVFKHSGILWMSPLTQLAYFAAPGMVLAVVARLKRRWDVLAFSVTILSLLGWSNLLLLIPGLHFLARIFLACGLAAVTGKFFQKCRDRCVQVIRRSVIWMVASVLLIVIVQGGVARHREASAVASLPDAEDHAPNVLLVVLDTVRADALELYGANREVAPNLCRLAREGVVFDRAWATSPWTLPSHAGMFTGRLPHETSADWHSPLDDSHPTLAEAVEARGWLAGGFVSNTKYCGRETGLARGFAHYEDYRRSPADFLRCTAIGREWLLNRLPAEWRGWRKTAPEVNDALLRWLEHEDHRPFFAFLNYLDAHDPYIASPGFRTRQPTIPADHLLLLRHWWWVEKNEVSDDQVKMFRGAYEDCIRELDFYVGQMLDSLRRRGELANTLIIITADHGEHFAEHDLFLHGNSLYEPLLHVPLIVVWPGKVPAGLRIETPVSLSGLPNTIMELVGETEEFPGDSWVQRWTNTSLDSRGNMGIAAAEIISQPDHPPCQGISPVALGPMRCVREGNLKYICNGDGAEELYDLGQDPTEQNNLLDDRTHRATLQRMRRVMQKRIPAPKPTG